MIFFKALFTWEIAVYLLHIFNILMLIFNFLNKDCFGMKIVIENGETSQIIQRVYIGFCVWINRSNYSTKGTT